MINVSFYYFSCGQVLKIYSFSHGLLSFWSTSHIAINPLIPFIMPNSAWGIHTTYSTMSGTNTGRSQQAWFTWLMIPTMKWEPAEAKMESQISSANESCEKKNCSFPYSNYFSGMTIKIWSFLSCQIYFLSVYKYKGFSYPSCKSAFIRRTHVTTQW